MWIALVLRDQFSSRWTSLWSSRDAVLQNVTPPRARFTSEVQPIITKNSVSPVFKTHFGNQTYKQNATKFIKILVCTAICFTMTSCSQHQWIWSFFFIRVDNKVNKYIFYILLEEENNKLFTRYLHCVLLQHSLLKVINSFPLENLVSYTNFLPKQKGLKDESL